MDRISALRNVEDALRAFEDGDADLAGTERRVTGVLRTFATEFDVPGKRAYRVVAGEAAADRTEDGTADRTGDETTGRPADGTTHGAADGVVVVAASPAEARERAAALSDGDADAADLEVSPLG